MQAADRAGFRIVALEKPKEAPTSKYTGATVLSAKRGLHMEPVACLDYSSLKVLSSLVLQAFRLSYSLSDKSPTLR